MMIVLFIVTGIAIGWVSVLAYQNYKKGKEAQRAWDRNRMITEITHDVWTRARKDINWLVTFELNKREKEKKDKNE